MALPVIQHPIYEVYLKSLDRNVKFRPFLVKEEKILLMTKETDSEETITKAVKQMISNCCLEDIDLDVLPTFDVEMFFVHLRMRSVGEKVMLNFTCKEPNEQGEVCGFVNEYELDLQKIQYDTVPNHTNNIKITDKIGVIMNYPTLDNAGLFVSDNLFENALKLIELNVKCIYDDQQVYDRSTFNGEELQQFIESLTTEQVDLLMEFFTNTPRVVIDDNSSCKKCDHKYRIFAENLYSFFI